MAKKEFTFRGKSVQEIMSLGDDEVLRMIPSRARRSVKRGYTEEQKKVMDKLKKNVKEIKTHARDLVILPIMIGKTIKIHNGKEFVPVMVTEDMIGHFLGEFALTRRRVAHNAPGVGATRSSSAVSVR